MDSFSIDNSYLKIIEDKFAQKREIASGREQQLFSIFDGSITSEEEMALKFLYAYMPLNDLADYDGSLFLRHVREAFRIRSVMPWGERIPDSVFLHFVLPYRMNNENIEEYRSVLFDELYDRVKELPMTEAILEVNHWCHEMASYVGCDPRTSSPLSVIRRALGRCGEESTLAVAALRSLGIPARQCYTPRWAHCDSNHAWVEAWADGKWYFFGACEPEARLNCGWFKAPTRRAMLINTRVPGNYTGPEEITLAHEWYTEINLMDNYTKVKKITVRVKGGDGSPVKGAEVYFQVYNFAVFTGIARLVTDEQGEVSLTTGFGDLFVHAACEDGWGAEKIRTADKDIYEITISNNPPECGVLELDLVPPPELHEDDEKPTVQEVERNNQRLREEDRKRAEYEVTFVNEVQAGEIVAELSLPADRVWKVLGKARGNSHEIAAFLREETPAYGELTLKLLESLAGKDLTDTFRPVLKDHLYGAASYKNKYEDETFKNYVLCPRVGYEMIGRYREFFCGQFTKAEQEAFRQEPEKLADWVKNNIKDLVGYTYYQGSATPRGSFELRKADKASRDIVFVAMARSFGIPARLEPADKRPQFLMDKLWQDAVLEDEKKSCTAAENKPAATAGRIKLVKEPGYDGKIEYYTNFSIARFDKNLFKTLDYEGIEWIVFEKAVEVLPGSYLLTTGNRLSDGTVLVRRTIFKVEPGETTEAELIFRKEEGSIPVLGTVPENCTFSLMDGDPVSISEMTGGQGIAAAWIEPDKEPSKHLIRELKELAQELDAWDGRIYLCIGDDKLPSSFNPGAYQGLPQQAKFCLDEGYESLNSFTSGLDEKVRHEFPLVFVMDAERKIRYMSVGYKLGIGSEVVKTVKGIKG